MMTVRALLNFRIRFYEDSEFSLMRRNKRQRISLWEKALIYKEVKHHEQRAIDVARKFRVSMGTVYNIIRNLAVCRPNLFSETDRISRKILNSQRIISLIQDYLDRTSHPFAWDDICRHLFKTFGIRLRREEVAKILKESLNMSYKRGKSRPVGFNKERQELLKCYL